MLAAALGCGGSVPVGPRDWVAFISAGDRQVGTAGSRLSVPLEVTVRDQRGQPLGGAAVEWVLATNGQVAPEGFQTDATGRARAVFTLGSLPGNASIVAVVSGVDSILFSHEVREPDEAAFLFDTFFELNFETFDGSGETVHPDYALIPWILPRQIAITPYPGGNAAFELPSVFAGRFLQAWGQTPGAPNPVVPAPRVGHLSDPDLVWNPDRGEAWLYYREASHANIVWLVRSADGVHWSPPTQVVSVPNHELVSPAVVRRGPGDWWMWSVNGGPAGCSAASTRLEVRHSIDGLQWSPPTPIGLAHDGLTPWHVDVRWIESRREFWAVYNAKRPGSCTTPALFLAGSADGVHWNPAPRPLVVKGAHPQLEDIVYRATFDFIPVDDRLIIWVSGARYAAGHWSWSTLLISRRASEIFAARSEAGSLQFSPPPAELIDWP